MSDESTPAPSEEQAAALAAMRAEWALIKDEVLRSAPSAEEEDDEAVIAELTRRTHKLQEFLGRHGATLQALGLDPIHASGAHLNARMAECLRAEDERKQAEEALLHAGANVGDAMVDLAVAGLAALEELEGYSQAQWDEMTPEARGNNFDALEMLRESREEFLERLPLELRREWERRLGD